MFEHSLIDMESRPRSRRWLSLPIAVALHLVALGTFAFASYWNVGEVPEPETNVVFFSIAPPPMPKLGGGTPPKPVDQVREETKPADPQKPVQPTPDAVPDQVPTPAPVQDVTPANTGFDLVPGVPEGPGVPWGDPNGDKDAVAPGDGPGTGDGPMVSGEAEPGPVYITVGITRPEIVRKVSPSYTSSALKAGVQGTVIIEAIIDEKGNVTGQRVLKPLPMGLDRAAMDAIRQWRFKPAYRGNDPVKVYFTLTVNFTVQR
ncbi:MAG TPA: energy transducer TonB [Thermoanaerobaculia bacterium]|nr:energy transducer TonB [Thermoanaerobaculia bacterium]